MAFRLSDLNEYSMAVAVAPGVQPLPSLTVPNVYAQQALTQRGQNGLALSECGQRRVQTRLNGLGELVQVVT